MVLAQWVKHLCKCKNMWKTKYGSILYSYGEMNREDKKIFQKFLGQPGGKIRRHRLEQGRRRVLTSKVVLKPLHMYHGTHMPTFTTHTHTHEWGEGGKEEGRGYF